MKIDLKSSLVNIGRIGSPVGIKGELKIWLHAPDSKNLKEGKHLLLKRGNKQIECDVQKVRNQKNCRIAKLSGVDDRDKAEMLGSMEVYIKESDMEKLPDGEYYVRDLIGYDVVNIENGSIIGQLTDVIQNTGQSILEINIGKEHNALIPAVDEFLKKIDPENRRIEVKLIPGLL